ncbi:serine hydrolase [Mesorhizobium sp. YM1C-6-2]|uniref:serine hydrolase domain-containing protein n=1 Tax=Mesorhizobium sp. YM1C-6-2 TaxID=1827501 RepID=UPI000EF1F8A6|nr:serine hydrolase [Mesorhizobium sp. YM1C-6-2]RLP22957.1 class C beta-lactamase-related serine hydrolase [Mesorhizobium sp. YM1C-6-2]
MNRRSVLSLPLLLASTRLAAAQETPATALGFVLDKARELGPLRSVIVSLDGKEIAARGYHGGSPDASTNIKSASKSIISALTGIAIDRQVLEGVDQKIAPILSRDLPDDPDPRMNDITIGNLLSMQAGLGRTSGPNYGRWVSSRNWVRAALAEPFDGEPGGPMLYSTGSTHLLSAILTKTGGKSTRELAREWLGPVEGFSIDAWDRDPQGIYVGGNQMAMTARSLAAFGELYRNGGRNKAGEQVVPEDWVKASWQVRTHSIYSGDGYGYGWFMREIGGRQVVYAWGFGGQMLYIVPALGLTVAMTSREDDPSARSGHRDDLHALLAGIIGAVGVD